MVIFCNLNAVGFQNERNGTLSCISKRKVFNSLVYDFSLLEYKKDDPKFSYSNNQQPPTLSKLDHLLANLEWYDAFPGLIERSLGFFKFDY